MEALEGQAVLHITLASLPPVTRCSAGDETQASCMPGRRSTTELCPQFCPYISDHRGNFSISPLCPLPKALTVLCWVVPSRLK